MLNTGVYGSCVKQLKYLDQVFLSALLLLGQFGHGNNYSSLVFNAKCYNISIMIMDQHLNSTEFNLLCQALRNSTTESATQLQCCTPDVTHNQAEDIMSQLNTCNYGNTRVCIGIIFKTKGGKKLTLVGFNDCESLVMMDLLDDGNVTETVSKCSVTLQTTTTTVTLTATSPECILTELESIIFSPNISSLNISQVQQIISSLPTMNKNNFNRIVNVVETAALKMMIEEETNLTILSSSVALAVKWMNGAAFQKTSFTVFNASNLKINGGSSTDFIQGSISLPASLLDNVTDETLRVSRVVFYYFHNSSHFQSIVQPDRWISGILGCSVNNISISNLRENVTITLGRPAHYQNRREVTCVFWDSNSWITSGCSTNNTAQNETVCSCNHLSAFGLLSRDMSSYLLEQSQKISTLDPEELNNFLSEVKNLLSEPNVSLELGERVIEIVNNLLDATRPMEANKIIGLVDEVGLKLVLNGQNVTILQSSVALVVKNYTAPFEKTMFVTTDSKIDGGPGLVSPQGSIVLPASLMENLTLQQQQQTSRVQFTFYNKSTLFEGGLWSHSSQIAGVLGSTVGNLSIFNLRENVTITLKNTKLVPVNFTVSCVFWNLSLKGGAGGWSREGCRVLNSTDSETVCSCNHLTSFSVLMSPEEESPVHNTILTYMTSTGCSLSVVFLFITLLTYMIFEKLRKDIPSKILIHLCLALMMLNIVFLLDSWLAQYDGPKFLCIPIGFCLHYFLLASFTWMALQAVYMYLTIIKVFNTYFHQFMIKIGVVGWGIPLILVITVISIDKNTYKRTNNGDSTNDFCWMEKGAIFYITVMGYFSTVFLLTFSMFVVVMVLLCRIKRQSPLYVRNRTYVQKLCSVTALAIILGLNWSIGFFMWGPMDLVFKYLFVICNSLHGFLIFVFYCAAKENARKLWGSYLCSRRFSPGKIPGRIFSRVTLSIAASVGQMLSSSPNTVKDNISGSEYDSQRVSNEYLKRKFNKDSSLDKGYKEQE